MKHLFFIFIGLLMSVQGYAQWSLVRNHPQEKNAMSVLNADTVVYVTYGGGIMHKVCPTGAGCNDFQTQFANEWFLDINFPTPSVGYACGGSNFSFTNIIVKTINGGVTWDSLTANQYPGYNFTKLAFFNADTGFVTDGKLVLRTNDGGQTFTSINPPINVTTTIVEMYCSSNRLFLGTKTLLDNNTKKYRYNIFVSDDFGSTWQQTYDDTMINTNDISNNRQINEIHFVSSTTGYAVGGNGLFLKTTDGGNTWENKSINSSVPLSTVFFTSENVGYINNGGGISKTTDGGDTWWQQFIFSSSTIYQIAFANDSIGYAIGAEGVYKTTNGGSAVGVNESDVKKKINIYPNPSTNSLTIANLGQQKAATIEIRNVTGQVVYTQKEAGFEKTTVNTSNIPVGVYWVNIKAGQQNLATQKWVKVE